MTIAILTAVTLSIPPAAKMLAVIGSVYGVLQGAKQIPAFTAHITGWKAMVLNVALTAGGLLIAIKPDQLYTTGTLNALLLLLATSMGSAGIHGTVKSLSAPTVLAVTPPSTEVKPVPATLIPDNPDAIPVKPK